MAVAFRNAAALVNSAASTSIVCNTPTGVAAGDVMVALIQSDSTGTVTGPSGWSIRDTSATINTSFYKTYTKVAGGSEPTTYTWSSTANLWAVAISAFSGVDNTNPVDGHAIGTTNLASVVCPSVTPASGGCMLVFGSSEENGRTSTFPGGSTEDIDTAIAGFGGIHMGHEQLSASGATGTRTITLNVSDNSGMFTIALAAAMTPSLPRTKSQAIQRASSW